MGRMGPRRKWGVGFLAAAVVGALGAPAALRADVAGSARYSGLITYYGREAPEGAQLTVHVGAQAVAGGQVTQLEGESHFSVTVPGDDPRTPLKEGPRENDILSFRVNGVPADQTELYNDLEDRVLPLTVSRLGICLGAFEDLDRDLARDEGEPWLADVIIHVLRFRTDLSYRTTGLDEPYCSLFVPEPKEIRAVDWPVGFEPPAGQGQPAIQLDETEGVFTVAFPFVRLDPAITTTPATPMPTASPTNAAPTPRPTAGSSSRIEVNSTADPGSVGDDRLTLREALRLAVGELAPDALSAAERQRLSGSPGATTADQIVFDPAVFPPGLGATIFLQPPPAPGPQTGRWVSASSVCQPVFWSAPRPSLPPLSTGDDTIDGTQASVTLSGELGGDLFDGLVITSDGNAIRGLRLRSFNAGVLLFGTARGNVLGGTEADQSLVIGQSIAGVVLHGADVSDNLVLGNILGAAADGSPGNATHGVLVAGGAHDNWLGQPGSANILGDNAATGVAVVGGGTRRNRVTGNRIGTNLAGNGAAANGVGVLLGCGASDNVVGGREPDAGNLISGNAGEGVWLLSPESRDNRVLGNVIGLGADRWTPLPNQGNGVLVSDGARQQLIGGLEPGAGNQIVANHGAGVRVVGAASTGIAIRRNSISRNGAGGIVLEDGANARLASPVITFVASPVVAGWGPPGTLVEVYSDDQGQGLRYEGDALTGADGLFRFQAAQPLRGPNITGLAVDGFGNTSAFGGVGVPPTPGPTATASPAPGVLNLTYLPLALRSEVLFARVVLAPAASTVPMGGLITLELRLSGARRLYGMQWLLEFPADVLEVIDDDPGTPGVQIAPGDVPDPSRVWVADNRASNVNGTIAYAFTLVEPPAFDGDGVVARVRFRGRAPGAATVAFRELALANSRADEIPAHGLGATIQVLAPATGTARPTATPTAPPSHTPTATPTALPSHTPTATLTAPPSHTPTVTGTAPPSPTPSSTPTLGATAPPSDTPAISPTPTETAAPSATATQVAGSPSPTTRPSQTPPPTVTAVPTGDPCARPLANPGFETDGAWTLHGGRPPRYSDAMAHSGRRSLYLGVAPGEANVYAYSSAWQPVTVPGNASTMNVSAWTFQGAEPGGGADRQLILVYDVDPADNASAGHAPIAIVVAERGNAQAWQRRSLSLSAVPWRGRQLWLYATVLNDGLGGRAYMLLDDAEVAFCP